MAFSLKGKTMAQATQMLDNALDKSDTGEQIINGIIKIKNDDGTPIDVQDENQVITQKYVDDKFDAYMTLNISIPHNIDLDAELTIESTEFYHDNEDSFESKEYDRLYQCKVGSRTSIKGIQLPKNGTYKIKYESTKTTTVYEAILDLKKFDFDTNVYSMDIIPVATLDGVVEISDYGDASRLLYSTTHNGGVHNNYYYAIFLTSCDRIILPNKNVEMFIMSAGQNAKITNNRAGYGFGGKRKKITANGNGDIASVTVGMNSWSDSSVTIGNGGYTTANSTNYSDKSDGVFPFDEDAFGDLYGASGSSSTVRYSTGGGYNNYGFYPGMFFGAGACGVKSEDSYGFQGIVIMRWEV